MSLLEWIIKGLYPCRTEVCKTSTCEMKIIIRPNSVFDGLSELESIHVFLLMLQTFNEFFIRELKPGVRPIASMDRDDVAVCAADCRLMAFKTAMESTRFWVKVLSNMGFWRGN